MGNDAFLIDILIFAAIAGFLILRLRSVLGRRHGEERRRPNPLQPQKPVEAAGDNVVRMPDRGLRQPAPADDSPLPIAQQVEQVRSADPRFDEAGFLYGARMAFEMIVGAFAAGDKQALRPLLSDDVFAAFAHAIDDRLAKGWTLETHLAKVEEPDLKQARLENRTAYVTVRFISHQINVTRDAQGNVVDGDPNDTVEMTDIWTFARDTRNADPNWTLVQTIAS